MTLQLKIALAQLNPIVGDIEGNIAMLLESWKSARDNGADLLVTTELFLIGYAPEDFVLKPRIWKLVREAVDVIARATASGPAILLGAPWEDRNKLYNAALLIDGGEVIAKVYKHALPNYDCFDEKRLFSEAPLPETIEWHGAKLGVLICEDLWFAKGATHLKEQGAELLIALNASPFAPHKIETRRRTVKKRINETGLPVVYINQVGGQDELLYDGGSFVVNTKGEFVVELKSWDTDNEIVSFKHDGAILAPQPSRIEAVPEGNETIYQGLMMGIRDYTYKNGFKKVLLGLSGGIDSALVAALAVDALGSANVQCVMMPSVYTSAESKLAANELSKTLHCRLDEIQIDKGMSCFDEMLSQQFMGCEPDVTEQNLQARIRGTLLMAISNKSGAMLLATGNKSELAVGYTTLYGDMCGGYAPLKDVYKTKVYELAKWRNENMPINALGFKGTVFSGPLLTKEPSAELAADQKDTDSLPNYAVLDDILRSLIERNLGLADIVMMGHDSGVVRRVYTMLDKAEYKRRQGPPGPKVTRRHLGIDRRYPMTNRFANRWQTQQMD